jgi:hypothetical protein
MNTSNIEHMGIFIEREGTRWTTMMTRERYVMGERKKKKKKKNKKRGATLKVRGVLWKNGGGDFILINKKAQRYCYNMCVCHAHRRV